MSNCVKHETPAVINWYVIVFIIINYCCYYFNPWEFFLSALDDGLFSKVWVTASLLKSPGHFSVSIVQ